ncbi:hypothetical protein CUU64_13115 [Bacillus sp. V5-8f]|nr:hypothetical protein CUU64_13115 [Bacillus sp. V5-8f]
MKQNYIFKHKKQAFLTECRTGLQISFFDFAIIQGCLDIPPTGIKHALFPDSLDIYILRG